MVKFNPEGKAIVFPGCLDEIKDIRTENEAQLFLKDFIDALQILLVETDPVSDVGAREWAVILIMYYLGNCTDMEVIMRLSKLFLLPPPMSIDTMRIMKVGIITAQFLIKW